MSEFWDLTCPVCLKRNRNLCLQETDGWMECDCCGSLTRAVLLKDGRAIPVLTDEHARKAAGMEA